MFSDVVMGFPKSDYERLLDEIKEKKHAKFDTDLDADDMKEVTAEFKKLYKKFAKSRFPTRCQSTIDGSCQSRI